MPASPMLPGLERPKRKPPRVMAKMVDAGEAPSGRQVIHYICRKCGWDSDWVFDDRPDSQIRKGIPCLKCNS